MCVLFFVQILCDTKCLIHLFIIWFYTDFYIKFFTINAIGCISNLTKYLEYIHETLNLSFNIIPKPYNENWNGKFWEILLHVPFLITKRFLCLLFFVPTEFSCVLNNSRFLIIPAASLIKILLNNFGNRFKRVSSVLYLHK